MRDRELVLRCRASELLDYGLTLLKATNAVVLCPEVIPPRLIARMEKWSYAHKVLCVHDALNKDHQRVPTFISQVGPEKAPYGQQAGDKGGPDLRHQGISSYGKQDDCNARANTLVQITYLLSQSSAPGLTSAVNTLCWCMQREFSRRALSLKRHTSSSVCAACAYTSCDRSTRIRLVSECGCNMAGALSAAPLTPALLPLQMCVTAKNRVNVDAQQWIAGSRIVTA